MMNRANIQVADAVVIPEPTVNIAITEYNRLYHRDHCFRELEAMLLRGEPFIRENWVKFRVNDPDFQLIPEIVQPKAQNRARTGTFPQGPSKSPVVFDGASKKKFNEVVSSTSNQTVPIPNNHTKAADSGKNQASSHHQKQSFNGHKQPTVGGQHGNHQPVTPNKQASKKKKGKPSPQVCNAPF